MESKLAPKFDYRSQGVNIGYSSRLNADACFIEDQITESVGPFLYRMNPTRINNCDACLSVFGPRSSGGAHSYGVSSTVGDVTAPSQALVDVESILSNRNVLQSRCKDGKVNKINVTKFPLKHPRVCNDFLDPVATHLTNPPQNYRGLSINRFYDLPKPPQENIYWDWSVNTQLEATDNYVPTAPRLWDPTAALPREVPEKPCRTFVKTECFN